MVSVKTAIVHQALVFTASPSAASNVIQLRLRDTGTMAVACVSFVQLASDEGAISTWNS